MYVSAQLEGLCFRHGGGVVEQYIRYVDGDEGYFGAAQASKLAVWHCSVNLNIDGIERFRIKVL